MRHFIFTVMRYLRMVLNTFKSKYRTLAFKGTNGKSPVFIYDGEEKTLLGLMMPVRNN